MNTKKIVIEQSARGEATYARQFVVEISADSEWDLWEMKDDSGPSDIEAAYVIGEADETEVSP